MKITSIRRTIRNTKRLAEITKVLSKFGFRQLVIDTGLQRFLGNEKDKLQANGSEKPHTLPRAVRVRLVLEELGPTFVKLGQILSTRPDLIPPEWAEEFKDLQDNCQQIAFADIYQLLIRSFPGRLDQLFLSIDEQPLAAASIAQVHRAILIDNSPVVIKVLRPGIRSRIEEDMALVESLAQLLEQYFSDLGYSPTAVAKEFAREMLKEINLVIEGQSTDRLRRYFEDDPHIYFPRVHWQATVRDVLTMEEITGKLLSTVSPDSLTPEERRTIVARGTDAVFKQCLKFGFFHADPHPGNIFLLKNDGLCFIDCGMTGQLDKKTTEQLINLVAGVIKGDLDRLCRVVIELTDVDPAVTDSRQFRHELRHLIAHFQDSRLKNLNITGLLSDFFSMLQRYQIQCPSDLVLLTKALTTIEGVAEQFDPSFDVLSHVEPQIQEIVLDRYSMQAIRKRIYKTLVHSLELMEELPRDLQSFIDYARHSHFTLNIELKRIRNLSETIDTSSRIMGIAMIIAALIVGSSILILADQMSQKEGGILGTLGILGLILAGVNTAGFIISFLLPRNKNK